MAAGARRGCPCRLRFGLSLPAWAHGPSLALVSIAIMTIWGYLGFEIVIFLVGLSNIPSELYEAARVDGEPIPGNWSVPFRCRCFLPLFLLLSIVTTIGSFQEFNRIYQMSTEQRWDAAWGTTGSDSDAGRSRLQRVLSVASRWLWRSNRLFAPFLILLFLSLIQFGLARRWSSGSGSRTRGARGGLQ